MMKNSTVKFTAIHSAILIMSIVAAVGVGYGTWNLGYIFKFSIPQQDFQHFPSLSDNCYAVFYLQFGGLTWSIDKYVVYDSIKMYQRIGMFERFYAVNEIRKETYFIEPLKYYFGVAAFCTMLEVLIFCKITMFKKNFVTICVAVSYNAFYFTLITTVIYKVFVFAQFVADGNNMFACCESLLGNK